MTNNFATYVVDDDDAVRDSLHVLLKTVGLEAAMHASPHDFLARFDPSTPCCVILDLRMPDLNGIETLIRLRELSPSVPVIFITGYGDASVAARAMKLGAVEFFEKPVDHELLLESVQHWIRVDAQAHEEIEKQRLTHARIEKLSPRERQVLDCMLGSMSNKETARHLGVSPKAVEIYRAHVMKKMAARSLVDLVLGVAGCVKHCGDPTHTPPCLGRAMDMDLDRRAS